MNIYFLFYPFIGIFAGLASGLLGIGGGLIVVPALVFVFTLASVPPFEIMHLAAGTSLAVMIVTAISGMIAHHRLKNILWPIFFRLLPSILIGVIVGAIFAGSLNTRWLEIIFGVFLLFISITMFSLAQPKPTRCLPRWPLLSLMGFVIGGNSGLLGVGGGAVTIPFLTYYNVSMRNISGISIACALPISIVGTISFIIIGWYVNKMPYSTGYVYWPAFLGVSVMTVIFAPVGASLNSKINVNLLKRIFSVFLLLVSIKMLF